MIRTFARVLITASSFASFNLALAACSSDEREAAPQPQQPPVLDNEGGDVFGGGTPGSGAGAQGNGGFDPNETCVGQEAGTELAPATLELLVDTSLSMDSQAPGSRQSKWVVTRAALLEAVDQMPATSAVGLIFYPDVGVGDMPCFDGDVDVEIGLLGGNNAQQRRRVEQALQSQSPDGSTPTHDAYRFALARLEEADVVGQRFLALITDGTPTYSLGCQGTGQQDSPSDPTPLIPEAASALARGIKTFVIGSPGSEDARDSLSRMAQAGGTSSGSCSHDGPNYCHFDMTQEADFAGALSQALAQIAGIALSCSYDVPAPPSGGTLDPSKVNVIFTPQGGEQEFLPRNDSSNCDEGWRYTNNQQQIELCRDTCERIEAASGAMSLQFGCEPRVIF
jgi:hypothetical protein